MSDLPECFSLVPPGSGWFGSTTDTTRIATRYRLTPDDYHAMLVEQDNECAICRRPSVSKSGRSTSITTKSILKRSCAASSAFKCNAGLGTKVRAFRAQERVYWCPGAQSLS
jgi:hypothetical protein